MREDGRGPSVWDKFSHTFGKILESIFIVDAHHFNWFNCFDKFLKLYLAVHF